MNADERFIAHLDSANHTIADWPSWKRDLATRVLLPLENVAVVDTDVLSAAYRECQNGRQVAATDLLVIHIDDLLYNDNIIAVRKLLDHADVTRLPPQVLTAMLMVTCDATDEIGETRSRFFDRVMLALEVTWHLSGRDRDSIAARLK